VSRYNTADTHSLRSAFVVRCEILSIFIVEELTMAMYISQCGKICAVPPFTIVQLWASRRHQF